MIFRAERPTGVYSPRPGIVRIVVLGRDIGPAPRWLVRWFSGGG